MHGVWRLFIGFQEEWTNQKLMTNAEHFWLHLLMCFNSKEITAVLFWDYQYSMIVQIKCELTKLSQQQYFQNYQSVSVKRKSPPFVTELKTFLTNKVASKHCSVVKHFGSGVVCILNRHTDSSKYGKTRKNTQRYYTPKRLRRCICPQLVLHQSKPNNSFSYSF